MNAKEFIRKFGWDHAKKILNDEHLFKYILIQDDVYKFTHADLKQYVDAYELVRSYGGIDEAEYHVYVETIDDCYFNVALSKSIALVEEINE